MNVFSKVTDSIHISERDRRTIMVGASVVVGLLAVFRGIPTWRRWVTSNQDSAVVITNRLAIARQTLGNVRGVNQHAASLARASLGIAPALVEGESPAQANSALASYLSETAENAGIQLGGVQMSVDSIKKGAELYRVHIRADGIGDVQGISMLFQLLEGRSTPLIAVKSFSISQSEPGALSNHAEALHASFELEALARRAD